MQVDNIQKEYNLSREAASRLLKTSMRTLDRYIKAKKMSTMVVDGRIWLSKEEVSGFMLRKGQGAMVDKVDMSTSKVSIDSTVDTLGEMVDKVDIVDTPAKNFVDIMSRDRDEDGPYRKLYVELRQELGEKQERLEIANYRVGQLENQLKNSIPLLEYHRENYERQKGNEDIQNKLNESVQLIKNLYQKIKYQKFSKRIFILTLLIILALQPLWLFFIYR